MSSSIKNMVNADNNNKSASPNTLLTSSISSHGISINNGSNFHLHHHHHHQQQQQPLLLQNGCSIDLNSMDEKEKRIICEFVNLLEKSRMLFNGLRELPQYGHKTNQWQAYFGRTFDIYTKLWKFQQQHRQTLDSKYNFKRWQIGEIASKIGQLYYHYYLRTSESNYLNEAYSFYEAIQKRAYYSKANKEEKPDIMVKKLRYYARFIVVCLLLKKNKQVNDLIKELSRQIDDYVKIFDPEDQLEWQMVKNEINDFIKADSVAEIVDSENNQINLKIFLSGRLNSNDLLSLNSVGLSNSFYKSNSTSLYGFTNNNNSYVSNQFGLQEIIIVGNCSDQIKFSELSLDMFRMLQACEREPSSLNDKINSERLQNITNTNVKDKSNILFNQTSVSSTTSQSIVQRENPHKYLLYKPSFSQFYAYISAAFKDLQPMSVLMLYVSADGFESTSKNQIEHSYDFGGLKTNFKKDQQSPNKTFNSNSKSFDNIHGDLATRKQNNQSSSNSNKESHCVYPGDLYPFLRKPFFLIVDSSNSSAFHNFPNLFQQPLITLLSSTQLPAAFSDKKNQKGSIFTLFLTNPLYGFCYICSIDTLTVDLLNKTQIQLKNIFIEIAKAVYSSKKIDNVYLKFCQDEFLRVFIFRYIFCYNSFKLHRGFKGQDYYPKCQPHLPDDVIENESIQRSILDLAVLLNIEQLFIDSIN